MVFLHGYLADKRCFYNQITYFERDFEVFAPDFKGFGENKNMRYPYSLDDYVEDIVEYFYAKGIRRPSVIAHSFGGRVAIKLASSRENFFDKLVLTGCAGLKPRKSLKKRVKNSIFKLLKPFLPKEKLARFYSSDYLSLSPIMRRSFIKIVNEHLDNRLRLIKNSTLIVHGERDYETPLYMAKRLNRGIKNSRLIVVKEAGHFVFLDKPNTFNMEVGKFLLS